MDFVEAVCLWPLFSRGRFPTRTQGSCVEPQKNYRHSLFDNRSKLALLLFCQGVSDLAQPLFLSNDDGTTPYAGLQFRAINST